MGRDMIYKKIAFFCPTLDVGGVEKVFITHANYLTDSDDYEVHFMLLRDEGGLSSTLSNRVIKDVIGVKRLAFSLPGIINVLKKNNYDFIFSGTEATNLLLVLASKMASVSTKVITSQHNYPDIETNALLHKIIPFVHRNAFRTFAVSKGIGDYLIDSGVPKRKLYQINNPIDISLIRRLANEQIGIELPEEYLVFVGRVYPVKNIPILLKSFAVIKEKYPNLKLIIVGDGPNRAIYEHQSEISGVRNDVIWIGNVSNPYPYIKSARLLVISSLTESSSNVAIEAMCLGVTVASTPCIGPEEIIDAPNYGYVAKMNNDAESLSTAIMQGLQKPIQKEKLSSRIASRDIQIVSKQLMDLTR